MVPAPVQGLVQIQGRDTPAGSFGRFSVNGQEHGRQMVLLRHPGGHDADDSRVPAFLSQHQAPFRRTLFGQLAFRFFKDLLAEGLPFLVGRIQFLCQLFGGFRIPGRQQLHCRHSVVQPARRIDPGAQAEADGAAVDGAARGHGHMDQGLEARQRTVGHPGQPFPDDLPVFVLQRHHVRHRAQGHQLDQLIPVKIRLAGASLFQGLAQLEGHPHPGDALEGILVPGLVGVHHRQGRRQLPGGQMVVRDDDVQSFGGIRHHLGSADPGIHGDQQLRAPGGDFFQGRSVETVPFPIPPGHIHIHFGPPGLQKQIQQGTGRCTVHVVIPVDGHGFALLQCLKDPVHSPVHIFQPEGIIIGLRLPFQEFFQLSPVPSDPGGPGCRPEGERFPAPGTGSGSGVPVLHPFF